MTQTIRGGNRYFDIITASFVAVLLISNIASTKIVEMWRFTFDGGTVIFPLAYIFGDVLTEVYGYARARRAIWTGFFWIAVTAGVFALIDALPAAPEYDLSESFSATWDKRRGSSPAAWLRFSPARSSTASCLRG